MSNFIKNFFINNFAYNTGKYTTQEEAVIISCYYNTEKNPYRLDAFRKFYDSIKHLNHYIVECVIGDAEPELPVEPGIHIVRTQDVLWHKEALLNNIVADLPKEYKYVFWVDADIIFTNQNWMKEAVEKLQINSLVQLFEYCVHLDQGEDSPSFNMETAKSLASVPDKRNPAVWKSFASNWAQEKPEAKSENYDVHGHVGFAWGARRAVLDLCPLYDKALVGGADHIIAHAAVGQIPCSCITNSFTADIDAVNEWSKDFYQTVKGRLNYVSGDVYHIWHGDVAKREYLKRIKEFTPMAKTITEKDENGLYTTNDPTAKVYVKDYLSRREDTKNYVPQSKKPVVATKNLGSKVTKTTTHTYASSVGRGSSYGSGNNNGGYFNNNAPQYDAAGNLIESAVLGYLTDSAIVGGMGGGSLIGGLIGQELRDSGNQNNQVQYGGGDFSGGGANGDFSNNNVQSDSTNVDTSQNFS